MLSKAIIYLNGGMSASTRLIKCCRENETISQYQKYHNILCLSLQKGSSQNAGRGPRVGVSFFLKFLCFNFCRYSPVMLYPNVRYFSLRNLRKV